ncbi:MAG: DUF2167 domain-containing protein [Chthoniobacterales bacterium]
MKSLLLLGLLALFSIVPLPAQPTPEPPGEREKAATALIDSLHFQQGDVSLSGGMAQLKVPATFRYLNADDAAKVLEKLWGNPPGDKTLGMLVPAEVDLMSRDSWAVLISYVEDGYVKDDDAAKINYDDLLKDMQKGTEEASKERVKEGYPAISLVGWAAPPRYDAAAKKLYWAKKLKFGDSEMETLNYDIRVLGRRGVLSLNCVASMDQLPEIERQTPQILSMVNFSQGHRYADFAPSTDKVAAYGIGALVLGGIAAKAGLFKVILVALLAAKKFVIVGAVALFSFIKKFFGKKNVS